jgi:hypothetical protein
MACRNLPRDTPGQACREKLCIDGAPGLHAEVATGGGTWRRFKYFFECKEKRMSLGIYPKVWLLPFLIVVRHPNGFVNAPAKCSDVIHRLSAGLKLMHLRIQSVCPYSGIPDKPCYFQAR